MQLQQNLSQFEDAGIALFAISNDPVEMQASFAAEYGITFPMLADIDSKVIIEIGILNTLIDPGEDIYGIPYPGTYVIDTNGLVEEKLFYAHYRTRPSAASVLRGAFGVEFDVGSNPHTDVEGEGVAISATLGGESMVFGEETTLYVDMVLDEGLHLYGKPIPDGYIATEVTVEAPDDIEVGEVRYPATTPFRVEGLDDEFNVFEGHRTSIEVPILNNSREPGTFTLAVNVRYQACSDVACFIPQNHTLELDVAKVALNRRES